ncbi:MAG TPA: MauE/DoxX family redox-associated membrane protein [Acidimicrobiia bacterium]|nr:MauE/DoxX family redox-associated membrane protein [Acidimicrobiia bacterium]
MEGWFFLVAALLVWSGIRKFADPEPTSGALRAAGLPFSRLSVLVLASIEVGVGAMALLFSGRVYPWAVAVVYAGFAGFVGLAMSRRLPIASCGCFGKADTPPTWIHLVINLAAVGGSIAYATAGGPSLPSVLGEQPLGGLAYAGFLGIGVYCLYLLLSELPRLSMR